ncbi:MAG: type II and III secretion system protein [Ignavibacteriae bacterium]|nr:type II and III secretion system protein [Ignavibacteria bacterium]MBI3364848.1 type II and III secretion system protein [Ignavibacteriota bacterium]
MKKHFLLLCVITILCSAAAAGQARDVRMRTKGYVNPQEIVSLDSTMRMDQALVVLNELSKQFAGKVIIDVEKHRNPIGVYIVNQHWRDALEMILSRNGLTYTEEPDYIRITSMSAVATAVEGRPGLNTPMEPIPTLESRDIKISAVFFNTNLSKLQDYGISWNFFRSKTKEPTLTGYLSAGIGRGDTTSAVPPRPATTGGGAASGPSLDKFVGVIQSPPSFTFANIDALVKFFGSNNFGDVVTSPEVIVRDGKQGRIQVGKDIFITTRDIAGNTINQQISTGTIIDVLPAIYTEHDTDFIYLNLTIEQSDVEPGPTINRTSVKTHALLYDGEETVIGGLYTTLESQSREGIPFLKDLPWWFLGLRYVFGSESKVKTKNELIVLLKAEMVRSIRDRISLKANPRNLMEEKRQQNQREYEKKE